MNSPAVRYLGGGALLLPLLSTTHAAPAAGGPDSLELHIKLGEEFGDIRVEAKGRVRHVINDDEARSFKLDTETLKNMAAAASASIAGKLKARRPSDVYLHPPTPWDEGGQNIWQRFPNRDNEPVTILIEPVGPARLRQHIPVTTVLDETTLSNESADTSVQLCAKLTATVQNSISYTWLRGSTDSIAVGVKLGVDGIGGVQGGWARTTSWGEQGSATTDVSYAAGRQACVCAPPKRRYRVRMHADLRRVVAEQDYRAELVGGRLLANYSTAYFNHHFYFWWMPELLDDPRYRLPHTIDGTQQVELGYYGRGSIQFQDLSTQQWTEPGQMHSSPFVGQGGC